MFRSMLVNYSMCLEAIRADRHAPCGAIEEPVGVFPLERGTALDNKLFRHFPIHEIGTICRRSFCEEIFRTREKQSRELVLRERFRIQIKTAQEIWRELKAVLLFVLLNGFKCLLRDCGEEIPNLRSCSHRISKLPLVIQPLFVV